MSQSDKRISPSGHEAVIVLKRGNGDRLRLGSRLGEGGEGVVHQVLKPKGYAVKCYGGTGALLPIKMQERRLKVEAMVRAGWAAQENEGLSHAAFPVDTVYSTDGEFVGFLMKVFDRRWPLHEVYSPKDFRMHFAGYDYRFLVKVAGNIARAVANIHATGCVIGDVNASGLLVSNDGTVALVDADSFQFEAGGRRFFCEVGQGEYTPPELQGRSFSGVWRVPGHDAFGLAVLIFKTLMQARHPFAGVPLAGDAPPLEEAIAQRRYAFAENRDTGLRPPAGMHVVSAMSAELAALFSQAFDAKDPARRPSAATWVAALDRFEESLVRCRQESTHWYPQPMGQCPWCARKAATGVDLFPSADGEPQRSTSVDAGQPQFFRQKTYRPNQQRWRVLVLLLKTPVLLVWLLLWGTRSVLRVIFMALGGLWRHGRLVLFAAVVLGALLSQVSASGGQVAYWRDRAGQLLVEVRYRGELALESVQAWGKNRWPAGWWPFDEARQAQVSGSPPVPVHAKVRNSAAEKERSGQLSSRHVTAAPQPRAGVVTSASTGAAVAGAVSLADPQPDRPGEADVLADASVQDASRYVARRSTVTDKVLYMQRILRTQGYPVHLSGSFDRATRRYAFAYLRGVRNMPIRESQTVHEFYAAFVDLER